MFDNDSSFVTGVLESYRVLIGKCRRKNGKLFRQRIERRFDAILAALARTGAQKIQQIPHARWLLDNSHLVRQALQQIETDLPSAYYQQLPKLVTDSGEKTPRIFALIEQSINQSPLPIECDSIESLCTDYNFAKGPAKRLTLGELWAIPISLRIILLSKLCDAAELGQENARVRAGMAASSDTEMAVTVIAGCITSLRTIAIYKWSDFVERTSTVERYLQQDPAAFYQRMDFATRDQYRSLVEKIAKRTTLEQWEVAQAAVQLAQTAKNNAGAAHQQHIGYYLIDKGRAQLEKLVHSKPSPTLRIRSLLLKHRAGVYLFWILGLALWGGIALMSGLIADGATFTVSMAAALIALIPLLSVSSGAVNFLASLLFVPRRLPKLDFEKGIPIDQRTIVVVPMLLSSADEIAENLKILEQNYLGNADANLKFALLSDFIDANSAETPEDKPLLDQALAGIDDLNQRYAENGIRPFMLFHRMRLWNAVDQLWMGWERKRGKLEEFNELLRGATNTSYVLQHGNDVSDTQAVKYVITLDADSYMPTGTAVRLVGTMAHPLNRPLFDQQSNRVVRGYTVIQPRLEINPVSGANTPFARIFAGDVLLDLYTNAVSDVYQDVFGEAVFAGKGIYDVDAFRRSVSNQIPTNAVLSHDLLEGLMGRAGLASDIVVLENYPPNYLVFLKRLHRWVRGDWQLLRWVFASNIKHGGLFKPGTIGRWKIVDNLRRSLVTPVILCLLVLAWFGLPGNVAAWTLLFAVFPGLPVLLRLSLALRTSLWRWGTIESSTRNLVGYAGADIARWVLALVFLPAEAYVVTDAIVRTLYRVLVSERRLLEWSTAAQVSRTFGVNKKTYGFWRNLWFAPVAAIFIFVAIVSVAPHAIVAASIFLVLWFFSPLIAMRLGRRIEQQPTLSLQPSDVLLIRSIARDTWRFFERFVGPESNWLPPDNVQEFPKRTIAQRTSPTNIGMMLMSTLTAHDLGYLGPHQLLARLSSHLDTIELLQKHRGHLLNWYSTRDLEPLEPRYVSTVDSGNFVAALIILRQTLDELPHNTHLVERIKLGLADELAAIRRQLLPDGDNSTDDSMRSIIDMLDTAQNALSDGDDLLTIVEQIEYQHIGDIERSFLRTVEHSPTRWGAEEIANFRNNCHVLRQRTRIILRDIELFAPWSKRLLAPPALLLEPVYRQRVTDLTAVLTKVRNAGDAEERLDDAAAKVTDLLDNLEASTEIDTLDSAIEWLRVLQQDIESAQAVNREMNTSRQQLISTITNLVEKTEFAFLYDDNRNLFRVGYNTSTGEADSSHYDLLASEARIASLVAIAAGDVPAKHWMHLGRPLTRIRGLRILLSWSATAFEYLMPRLIMHSPASGLLNQSCEGVVRAQIRFGNAHGIPWGISESGYAQFDAQNHYQYFAFGIPKLGLKWDQGGRLVVSSYASLIALPFAPQETIQNLRKLVSLHASGRYGLFEALDFGDAHHPRVARPQVVQSYMAHHQGMILVAIGNALHADEMLNRFHRDPRIASVEYLLFERLPQRIQTRPLERLPSPLKELPNAPATITQWQVKPNEPEVAILSNGRLSSRLSDQGGGGLNWQGMAITRWDPLREGAASGTCVYLKDLDSNVLRNLGAGPIKDDVQCFFAPHLAEFRGRRKNMLMRMTVTVSPTEDVEVRKVTITNDGEATRHVTLSSYSEPVLGMENADRRHPAFSKLFVESQFLQHDNIVLFRRRPREPDQPPVYFAHTAHAPADCEVRRQVEVDRGAFFGRAGDRTKPAALIDPSYTFSATAKANLDPCAAILLTLDVPPHSTVQCAFLSAVANNRTAAIKALTSFQSMERIDWTLEAAQLQSERELTLMQADSEHVRASFKVLAQILWPHSLTHISNNAFNEVYRVQDSLWRHGISGDRPIVTLRVDGEHDLKVAESLLKTISYLSLKHFAIDVIFVDETKGGYALPISDHLRKLIDKTLARRDRNGALAFLVPARNLSAGEKTDLVSAARLFIDARESASEAPLTTADTRPYLMPAFVPQPSTSLSSEIIEAVAAPNDLQFKHFLGGMLPGHSAYSLLISDTSKTPAPWCNVLANSNFGTLVSESGSMSTWWGNSSEFRLTPWSNDAVLDRTGEALYVRDEETGVSWSLTPQARPDDSPYRVTHAIGKSNFEHNSQGLKQRLQVFVDPELPVKFLRIRFTNMWPRTRRLTVTFAVDWLLGNGYAYDRHLLLPEQDADSGALLVRNGFNRQGDDELAFIASNLPAHGVSCDGREFFGQRQSWKSPAALYAVGLSDRIEPNSQPCGAYQVHIELSPNESSEFHFVLGAADDRKSASELIANSRDSIWVDERYLALHKQWDDLLNAWHVKTPDLAADAMINQWLLYQVISSRIWGRIGFYQASGGFGFRDQLQDVLALLDVQPGMVREQILIAASRQFEEGDVLHWWHEAPLRGVRTRCSDDLLWLPYIVSGYIESTNDSSILNSQVPFLHGEALGEHELERYAEFRPTSQVASIYEHCCRAIDARTSFGAHGLPFIGTGDWNDGLNRVGEKGQGESVWMAWFLVIVCRLFAPLCRQMDDNDRAEQYQNIASDLLKHTQVHSWSGDWYLRGYFDDGTPLGAPGDAECEIDLNAQTWAVLADPTDANVHKAMQAVDAKLIDPKNRLIKLLAPPFENITHDPGYIRSYPRGVRENGGQYTHAAVWAAYAAVQLGDKDKALRWFDWLNPLKRVRTKAEIEHYRIEPYVTPGDIYGVDQLAGRGGWSWYTGSAAWLYRFALRQLLGLQRRGDQLFIRPCLPPSWPFFQATLRHHNAVHQFHIHDPTNIQPDQLYVVNNGVVMDVHMISLEKDGAHEYQIFASDAARQQWLEK